MENWAGFTDADLRSMKQKDAKHQGSPSHMVPAKRQQPVAIGQRRPNQPQKKLVARKISPPLDLLPPDQRLSKPNVTKNKSDVKSTSPNGVSQDATQTGTGTAPPVASTDTGSHRHSQDGSTASPPDSSTETPNPDDDLITDDKEIFKHESHTMESFQKQQKMIQELNKKKKQMLSSAIIERSKKAKAESAKLQEIQKELLKLDQLLTVDVSIIRDKIEDACREFFDAQKRYERAEKEFIESKIDLHQKMETKEQLTEHLYTVIYQNEMRKSKKLAELMTKLEMEAGESPDILECDMPHPSLLSPVQIPAGRYGQIGLIKTDTPPTSPEAPPTSPEAPPTAPEAPPTSPEAPPTSPEAPPIVAEGSPQTSEDSPAEKKPHDECKNATEDDQKNADKTSENKTEAIQESTTTNAPTTTNTTTTEKAPPDVNQNSSSITAGAESSQT